MINFDTGSADLVVPSAKCTAAACTNHQRYDPAASSTSATNTSTLRISYGDGSTISGKAFSDTVSSALQPIGDSADVAVGSLSATGQVFGAAMALSDSFVDDAFDGILGMGFQSISTLKAPPFFQTLVAQNKVPSPQFSFKLGTTGSELYLGGANPASYTGDFEWHALSSSSYWVLVGAATVGGQQVISNVRRRIMWARLTQAETHDRTAFSRVTSTDEQIDSGSTYIVAPVLDAAAIYAQVTGSKTYNNGF